MTNYAIRRIGPDEARPVADTVRAALLGGATSEEDAEWGRRTWAEGRFLAAFEGDRCIGHVGSFDGDSTVPGGARLRTAAVTRVGVLPTHTRQGLLTTLMTQLLNEERDAGSVVATLWASETAIYGRFGFGHASNTQSITVDAATARPLRSAPIGSTRLLDRNELDDVVPGLYERAARWRPGSMSRQAWMWDRSLKAAREPTSQNTSPGMYVAVHSDASGVDDGYVHYEVSWAPRSAGKIVGTGTVHDLWAADARTETELWRYLLGIDLVATWQGEARPVDEAMRHVLADGRAYGVTQRFDELWLRILDVDAALTSRHYAPANGSVVVGVADDRFADNTGAWRISAAGATRVDAEPDIVVDIATLSAAYLGGTPWSELRDAGIVSADAPVRLLDSLFVEHPAPYCGTDF
ncbi:MAG: GNAT family N-acetyltransferase [Actinomycetota bacterium]